MGLCVVPSYWRRGYLTGSSVYSESHPGLCVRACARVCVLRYAIPGESWTARCCCLFAQLVELCVCVCVCVCVCARARVRIGTLHAHVVFLIPRS